jgi:hypothetical protein
VLEWGRVVTREPVIFKSDLVLKRQHYPICATKPNLRGHIAFHHRSRQNTEQLAAILVGVALLLLLLFLLYNKIRIFNLLHPSMKEVYVYHVYLCLSRNMQTIDMMYIYSLCQYPERAFCELLFILFIVVDMLLLLLLLPGFFYDRHVNIPIFHTMYVQIYVERKSFID